MIPWRRWVHRATGKDMHRHFTLSKGECRIELVSEPDGHTFRWAELYRFGELVDETDDEMQVRAWMIGAV